MNTHPVGEIPALIRGEISPELGAQVGQHLAMCASCRADLLDVAIAIGALEDLRRADLAPVPPLKLPVHRPRLGRWQWIAAALAAAVLVLGTAVGYLTLRSWLTPTPGPAVQLVATNGSSATGEARMLGHGQAQRMSITVHGLPPAPKGMYYQISLVSGSERLPVGILEGDEGTYVLPASLAQRYSAVDVSLEPVSGSGSLPSRDVLRGNL